MIRAVLTAMLALALAACGETASRGAGKVASASARIAPTTAATSRVRSPLRSGPLSAQVLSLPGLEGVIGATSAQLVRSFGPARLDVIEGDAHKLQFSGTACVLDIYLYPPGEAREPQVTYLDARRPSDGRDVDRAACVAALRRPR